MTDASSELLAHILLPVANEEDARESAHELERYHPARVTVLHVIEKGGGVPDKTPVEHSEQVAAESAAAVREVFPEAEATKAYGRDVAENILDVADTVDATAIAVRSRGGSRLMHLLSGDILLDLATSSDRPVIVLPIHGET